jgi:hypothetical protein
MRQNSSDCPLTLYDGQLAQWQTSPLFLDVRSFGDPGHNLDSSDWVQTRARVLVAPGLTSLRRSTGEPVLPGR